MPVINKHISIPKSIETKDDLDFHFLRKKGIEYIENLGGQLWTDFNSHDPGITMLEMLSYAITDLGMRINIPIKDILTDENKAKGIATQFYKASEIFRTNPVTELDYRKLFIDIKGVKNCWLQRYHKKVYANCKKDLLSYNNNDFNTTDSEFVKDFCLNGLYTILVDMEDDANEDSIKKAVRKAFNANRNLCEDLVHINKITTQPIALCAEVEVEKNADEELINAKIIFEVEKYFSPSIRFYSIKEMLDKGYTTDQIFDGPILNNGFIDAEELKNAALKTEVRLSDIMKIIMNIDGVKLIKEISIGNCDDNQTTDNEWNICIDQNKKPEICSKSALNFTKGVLPLNVNESKVAEYLAELKEDEVTAQESAKEDKLLTIPKGTYRDVASYTTIQNDFPDTYGIGQDGLKSRATTERKSQAKQLKTYLLFFDKILASYFKHLEQVKDLLAINGEQKNTYFTQAVKDIKGFNDLVDDYDTNNDELLTKKLFEKFDNNIERRNEILDHLLARFAEQFGEYTFIMKSLYGNVTDDIVLANKEAFLNEYDVISAERGTAFNYYRRKILPASNDQLWNTNNVAGIQKRIARLMGIKNYNRRNLSDSFVEMYDLSTNPDIKKYRWRINDTQNTVLCSTISYSSTSDARKELYFAVFQIMQTSEKMIIDALAGVTVFDNLQIGNFYIHRAASGKYSFHIIDPKYPISHTDFIIAKQYKHYDNITDLKKGMIKLIRFMIKEFTEEGLFLVEHILLRPNVTNNDALLDCFLPICTDNCENLCDLDPYSYKITIVLPGYTFRFSNPDFRNYMETIIKEELPAHILARICWVGDRKGTVEDEENDLLLFEKSYEEYLKAKTNLIHEQPGDQNENEEDKNELKNLITAMSKLNTIYPTGSLIDCSDESDSLEGKIILGQTILGTL